MKVLTLAKNPLNIQKCVLPDSQFLRDNSGQYCVITENKCKFIAKIGSCEIKSISDTVFLDSSVSIFSSFEKALEAERLTDITLDNITVVGKPNLAKLVKVRVVFDDVFDIKKHRNLSAVLKDILKLFAFSSNSSVSLNCLLKNQKFGINRVIILDVNGSKKNDIFKIGPSTIIEVEKCISQLYFEQSQLKGNEARVGGCSRVYAVLKECVEFSKWHDRKKVKLANKVLLVGPSGCGKTTLVHNVASDCKCMLLELSPSKINILSAVEVEKMLRNYFQEAKIYAKSDGCCIILIENIDMMISKKAANSKRFVGQLISLLEDVDNESGVVVVATTSSPEEVDVQLKRARRLEDELEIMVPTAEERVDILKKILNHCNIDCSEELLWEVSNWTPGFVGADLKQIVVEALMSLFKTQGSTKQINEDLFKDCFKQALTKVIPSALRGTIGLCTIRNMSFSEIGGLEDIKRSLDMLIKQQLFNPQIFQKLGIPLTKGVLLYGPPGCAKTTLVRALAKECNATFIATSAADLYSPFVGDAEKKIVQLFTQARIGSPSILFIDEIDAVVGSKSGDRERGVQERILSTLLIEMDGVGVKVTTQRDNPLHLLSGVAADDSKDANGGVIVIGATNRPQMLDDALKRPGRFDRLLYVPPPDERERLKILEKLTEKMPLHDSVNMKKLAKATNYYSGADLKNFCQESAIRALTESKMAAECVRQSHFDSVLKNYKPSLNEKVLNFYESFQKYNL